MSDDVAVDQLESPDELELVAEPDDTDEAVSSDGDGSSGTGSYTVDGDDAVELRDRLVVIVPSRGRPEAIDAVADAWRDTGAWRRAVMLVALDDDDPAVYPPRSEAWIWTLRVDTSGMAPTVNAAARLVVEGGAQWVAVLNDDHLPRTPGWVGRYIEALEELRAELGVGVVYGDDLLRGKSLCTEWAVTASWVTTLGRMIPALVRHQHADTSVRDLARAAGCLRFLPDVVNEHMHPTAGKREWDETTTAANTRQRRADDRRTYDRWTMRPAVLDKTGLARQAAALRSLRP